VNRGLVLRSPPLVLLPPDLPFEGFLDEILHCQLVEHAPSLMKTTSLFVTVAHMKVRLMRTRRVVRLAGPGLTMRQGKRFPRAFLPDERCGVGIVCCGESGITIR
jgi:hypothetical protein